MLRRTRGPARARNHGVSEVTGTLFLLVMTVAFFSIIIVWVYGFDTPETENRVSLFPTMERIDADNANVTIYHRGGESMVSSHVHISLTVSNVTNWTVIGPYNFTDGCPGDQEWQVGDTWCRILAPVPEDAFVELMVVDTYRQTLILQTELQRGVGVGGMTSPIVGVPVFLPDEEVTADGSDQFYIRVVAVDFDNDLPDNGVVADLRPVWNGLGIKTLDYIGFGIYESEMITAPSAAFPGEYQINVTATDSEGHQDTNWAQLRVLSEDQSPPFVVFTHPTPGEISAGTANKIVAAYTDSNGIDTSSVTMEVWEDDYQLDTSTKLVTDTTVTFMPFGGFVSDAIYRVNVSVADMNGNRAYADTIFRTSTYSQPGNPRGETGFDVMDKQWNSTTTFEHDDYIRVQLWTEVMPRIDDSELRLTRTDSTNVFLFKDRFEPNLTVPEFSETFPWYVYDATIFIETDGAYGGKIPPGFYSLKMVAEYANDNYLFENQIQVVIKYQDGSLPDVGAFLTFNETGRWSASTQVFQYEEIVYIQIVTDSPLEGGRVKIEKVMISISEVYGDLVLYKELARTDVNYVGPGLGGYVYRMQVDLKDTIGGGQWFCGANWYPLEIVVETRHDRFRPHPWKWWKTWTTFDIAFEAATQIKIVRPSDIGLSMNDVTIYHGDGTTTETNSTVLFGEELVINVTVWNYGDVDVTNALVEVWAISQGVTLDYWEMESDYDFIDPNANSMLDADATYNYVEAEIYWNTSRTGYDQATLEKAKIVVHVEVLQPLMGGYGSDPIPEIDYANNDVTKYLIPSLGGTLIASNIGFTTQANCDVGELDIVVDRLVVSAIDNNVQLRGFNVTKTGNCRDSDIARVAVYEDINSNNHLDGADRLVDSGVFTSGRWNATENTIIYKDSSRKYLIVYDISDAAIAARDLGSRIALRSDIYVESPSVVSSTNIPLNSELCLIVNNQNQLDGSSSGPATAFPSGTLTYTLFWTAENTDPTKQTEGSLTLTGLDMQITGAVEITTVALKDDVGNVLDVFPAAGLLSFSGLRYTIQADSGRVMYIEMGIKPGATLGNQVGITITSADATLASGADVVSPGLSIARTSTVQSMAPFFTYIGNTPQLENPGEDAVFGFSIGISDPTADVWLSGVSVGWTDTSMPTYTLRVYIDGLLAFEDDGFNHKGSGDYVPFIDLVKLNAAGKTVRIEFDMTVIKVKGQGSSMQWTDNDVFLTWHFSDTSTTTGGQYIFIDGAKSSYTVSWASY